MKLAITICATKSYTYAMIAQARRVQAMVSQCPKITKGYVIIVGDGCEELKEVETLYAKELLPECWEVKRIVGNFVDGHKNYKNAAQLVIARMRSAAFSEARRLTVDACLSLDSDVLPQSNSLAVMLHSLEFDNGYYGVSTCPYPSQGGGDFLGGRGIPENPILPDIYPDERIIPSDLRKRLEDNETRIRELAGKPDEAWNKESGEIRELLEKCDAKGDVFFRNSTTGVNPFVKELKARLGDKFPKEIDEIAQEWKPTGHRRRGWCSSAYPAIGAGAMLPTDWCGFGCTTMSREALALAQFDGYDGGGTEDLYIVFKRWHRSGVRINMLTHSPVDHVIRDKKKKGKYILLQAHHEDRNPECIGHLRIERRPWFQQVDGEGKKTKQSA